VRAIVKLGPQNEIGIIYTSTYEYTIAGTVSVALPYLYASEEEAIAKLIDKNVDYNKKPSVSEIKNIELDKANHTIEQLKKEINELKNSPSNNNDSIKELNEKVNELTGYRVKFDELTKDVKKNYVPKKDLDSANSNIKELSDENSELKEGLEKSLKQIEVMKADFNAACVKFKLSKKDAEWIQESE
jgi:predicted  nucleic acid-binding Zn-ribbon protein